jgi:2-keto-4-pentenoate hydratase/2-oxohepta-3-ene-1,7-dioic acid hydratase in catechol pathway
MRAASWNEEISVRYVTFSLAAGSSPRLGTIRGDRVHEVSGFQTLLEFIDAGPQAWRDTARGDDPSSGHPLSAVRVHAPIPRPRKNVFCLGLNYISHMRESKIPEAPIFFSKTPTSVTGAYDDVPWDRSATGQVDYEAELGVIIGIGGKNIPRARALEHVFGYTIINDVSARDIQMRHMQWHKGKSLDGFCPMGPYVVTADEFGDPQAKRIALRLNGETRQDANTKDMIFPVDVCIESLSRGMTIEPGDIIATGTPEGVGLGRTPPEYMKDGDVFETEIEGIGTMRNRLVANH